MKDGKKETFKIIILILSAHFYISFSFTCSMSNKEIYAFCCLVKYLRLILTKRLINQIKLKNQNIILDHKYHRCGKENSVSLLKAFQRTHTRRTSQLGFLKSQYTI